MPSRKQKRNKSSEEHVTSATGLGVVDSGTRLQSPSTNFQTWKTEGEMLGLKGVELAQYIQAEREKEAQEKREEAEREREREERKAQEKREEAEREREREEKEAERERERGERSRKEP